MRKFKRCIAALSLVVLLADATGGTYAAYASNEPKETQVEAITNSAPEVNNSGYQDVISYYDYLMEHKAAAHPDTSIEIQGSQFLTQKDANASITSYYGKDNVLCWDSQEGTVTWEFDVAEEGLYNLAFHYSPMKLKSNDIQVGIRLDGTFPFFNAKTITLPRMFLDETYRTYEDWDFENDNLGNELRPKANEVFDWQFYTVVDGDGQYNGELQFFLSQGRHTITLEMQLEALAINSLVFYQADKIADYNAVLDEWNAEGVKDTTGFMQIFQAEKSYMKSSNTLFPTYDKSSVSIQPSSPYATLYNTIGKNTWDNAGEYISWEFDVPEDGYYCFAFKVKQNIKRGMYSTRELRIDDKVLFNEMKTLKFDNKNSWYIKSFHDQSETPYKIYLPAGKHTLKMTVAVGDMADVLRRVDEVVEDLNSWYREIVKITGVNADSGRITIDSNRDFLLNKKIPGLMEGFKDIKVTLEGVIDDLEQMDGLDISSASIIAETVALMDQFIKKPGKIANRIETYRNSMSSLATWTIDMRIQPLEMDYFAIYSPDVKTPKIRTNVFKQVWYRFSMFLDSFIHDNNTLGGTVENDTNSKPLTVWVSTSDLAATGVSSGRDQAMLLKRMIDDMFVPEAGIPVDVSLVNSSATLTQAVLAGKGPDVALFVSKDTPVNLAMRGALLDLSSFDDFDTVTSQFKASAMIPYQYRGKYYALPETQSYDMLFYRTDVFAELGLTPPDTWDEFYSLIPILMDENYLVGIPESQRTFEMFLYQNGGRFYNDNLSKTAFDTGEALKSFEAWTGLYAKYSLPLIFDFFNRFRNGEMPMAIMPYTQVNYLSVAAPELKNLWDIAPVPGTLQNDNTINHAETSNGTASIILADTEQPDNAYKFLKWWVGSEAQSRFGVELEQNMGPGARYPTANMAAFDQLPWSKKQADSLKKQWDYVTDVPQIPGSYYISRNISFAFKAVVYRHANERETLYKYNIEINKEIVRKLKEFELSN
jgi:ABC-type glycerol-3-phosphate transport system substrate-binding protein